MGKLAEAIMTKTFLINRGEDTKKDVEQVSNKVDNLHLCVCACVCVYVCVCVCICVHMRTCIYKICLSFILLRVSQEMCRSTFHWGILTI